MVSYRNIYHPCEEKLFSTIKNHSDGLVTTRPLNRI
jgi:hypothetical protein